MYILHCKFIQNYYVKILFLIFDKSNENMSKKIQVILQTLIVFMITVITERCQVKDDNAPHYRECFKYIIRVIYTSVKSLQPFIDDYKELLYILLI